MPKTAEELTLEEKALELEERKADLENKRLANAKLRREAEQDRMTDENKAAQDKAKGKTLDAQKPQNMHAVIRKTCNHLMGGKGREAFIQGRGNDDQYCVTKTKLPTGDVIVRCPRCRTVWAPPLEAHFYRDKDGKFLAKDKGGKLDKVAMKAAQDAYNEAYNFRSDLEMVLMPQYRWSRGGKPINREVTYRYLRALCDYPTEE